MRVPGQFGKRYIYSKIERLIMMYGSFLECSMFSRGSVCPTGFASVPHNQRYSVTNNNLQF